MLAQQLSDLGMGPAGGVDRRGDKDQHNRSRQNGAVGNKHQPDNSPAPATLEDDSSDEEDEGRMANDGTLLASDPPKPL